MYQVIISLQTIGSTNTSANGAMAIFQTSTYPYTELILDSLCKSIGYRN